MTPVKFPRSVDEPPFLFIWRLDDIAVFLLCLGVGLALDRVLVLTAMGVAFSWAYRRYRDRRPNLFLFHLIFWQGFWPDRGHTMFNPWIREIHA